MRPPARPASRLYYVDLVVIPMAVIFVALLDRANWSRDWLIGAAVGLYFFTFVEYWTHRTFLHCVFWSAFHQRHHRLPTEYVIFPWWYLPLMMAVPALILPWPVLAGWYTGMFWFYAWHHVLHHWDLRKHPWLLAYSNWHELHHKDLPVNYGITWPLWDVIFGTYCSTERGHKLLTERMLGRKLARGTQALRAYAGGREPPIDKVTVTSNIRPHTCGNRLGGRRCDVCFARLTR